MNVLLNRLPENEVNELIDATIEKNGSALIMTYCSLYGNNESAKRATIEDKQDLKAWITKELRAKIGSINAYLS